MLFNLILVTALVSPSNAFKTSQKLVGRAFGASAGYTCAGEHSPLQPLALPLQPLKYASHRLQAGPRQIRSHADARRPVCRDAEKRRRGAVQEALVDGGGDPRQAGVVRHGHVSEGRRDVLRCAESISELG